MIWEIISFTVIAVFVSLIGFFLGCITRKWINSIRRRKIKNDF